ncbi:MAG: class I SAM-dependent methyltransferase [Bryobacter sp.]|nr:class I SAM-dependent methyltransferase [Bryobacter sp.]
MEKSRLELDWEELGEEGRILDLGSGPGSFGGTLANRRVVQMDLDRGRLTARGGDLVCADAARQPFRDQSFGLVVANHSLEHIVELEAALEELRRTLRDGGVLFVTVPDATTLADKLYRWLARGGGHVNDFVDLSEFVGRIETATNTHCVYQEVLHAGFTFLNRRGNAKLPRRAWLLGGGFELPLALATWVLRWMDHRWGTRYAVYGWCCVFRKRRGERRKGQELAPQQGRAKTNVCVRCGMGHEAERLSERLGNWLGIPSYHCPNCGARNFFTRDGET